MSDITAIDQSFHLDENVEIGKFTCLSARATNYTDGCVHPAGANAAFLGIAQESILPDAMADYSGGQYTLTSGTAWPAGSIPTTGQGRNIRTRIFGISRVVANAPIARGAVVIVAATSGYVETCPAQAGTTYNVVGIAIDAAGAQGDVIRVLVMPYLYKA
jgi:hypothetical protein